MDCVVSLFSFLLNSIEGVGSNNIYEFHPIVSYSKPISNVLVSFYLCAMYCILHVVKYRLLIYNLYMFLI